MKTTIDAVNEFKGDFDQYDAGEISTGAGNSKKNDCWKVIGTRDQFNELVSQMETNFGESSLKHLLIWQDELKRQRGDKVEIDWSKAPDGATHYVTVKDKKMTRLSEFVIAGVKGSRFEYDSVDGGGWSNSINSSDEYIITPRPQPKPVYTQSMADNGELPSVGMKIKLQYNQTSQPIECELLFISEQYMIVKEGSLEQHYHRDTWHPQPIDTRTDKEKLFDQINSVPRIYIDDANELVDKIILGRIHGVKWVGKS